MITRLATCLAFGLAVAHGETGAAVLLFSAYLWHLSNEFEAGVYDE